VAYFLSMFLVYARSDYLNWKIDQDRIRFENHSEALVKIYERDDDTKIANPHGLKTMIGEEAKLYLSTLKEETARAQRVARMRNILDVALPTIAAAVGISELAAAVLVRAPLLKLLGIL
jgi:hypothetical protein